MIGIRWSLDRSGRSSRRRCSFSEIPKSLLKQPNMLIFLWLQAWVWRKVLRRLSKLLIKPFQLVVNLQCFPYISATIQIERSTNLCHEDRTITNLSLEEVYLGNKFGPIDESRVLGIGPLIMFSQARFRIRTLITIMLKAIFTWVWRILKLKLIANTDGLGDWM